MPGGRSGTGRDGEVRSPAVQAASSRGRAEGTVPTSAAPTGYAVDSDALWPRDAEHRFRVYALDDDDLHVIAAAPTAQGAGLALATLHDDAKAAGLAGLPDIGKIGLLDVRPGQPTGEWIVKPWERGAA